MLQACKLISMDYTKLTFLFFRSLSAAKSSGASDGTLVTIPVPKISITFFSQYDIHKIKHLSFNSSSHLT